jgi:hypothetical protein
MEQFVQKIYFSKRKGISFDNEIGKMMVVVVTTTTMMVMILMMMTMTKWFKPCEENSSIHKPTPFIH